jgi:hypothetical protein
MFCSPSGIRRITVFVSAIGTTLCAFACGHAPPERTSVETAASRLTSAIPLGAHDIVSDDSGKIVPWYSANIGEAYDHGLDLVWNWYSNLPPEPNGVPSYMQSATYGDRNHLAADSHGLALTSWRLFYAYSGNPAVLDVMRYIADFTLDYGMSPSDAAWPNLMYETNTRERPPIAAGFYDGEVYAGPGYLLPHSSANFANQLVDLYKMTGNARYLSAAIASANTLASNVREGDADHSPYPMCVSALTGTEYAANTNGVTAYLVPALELFGKLIEMGQDATSSYASARATIVAWLKTYAMDPSNGINRFGFYFEDDLFYYGSPGWPAVPSAIETTPDTLARWILENPSVWGADSALSDAKSLIDFSYDNCGNNGQWNGQDWLAMGVMPISEETWEGSFPGNSHTAHHYSVELMYDEQASTAEHRDRAIRGLNWATYMVADDGTNFYPGTSQLWFTDGYGDYAQHYLRAMAALPDLASDQEDHLLRSSSVVSSINYGPGEIRYTTYDSGSTEVLRVTFAPSSVTAGGVALARLGTVSDLAAQQGYTFQAAGDASGVLRIRHDDSSSIVISSASAPLVGTTTMGSSDWVPDGIAEAFQYRAGASGAVSHLSIYIDGGNRATSVTLGIYSDASGTPGELLAQATALDVADGSWAIVSVPRVAITQGNAYWLAVQGHGGEVHIRDQFVGGGSAFASSVPASDLTDLTYETSFAWPQSPMTATAY